MWAMLVKNTINACRRVQQALCTPDQAHNPPSTGIPLDHTLSSDDRPHMPRHTSTSSDIPTNILAFRSITTLLAQLQPTQMLEVKPTVWTSNVIHTEARISDSFAHLAVAEHDVIAIATTRSVDELGLLACANLSNETSWNVWLAKNPRTDERPKDKTEPLVSTIHPTIVRPSKPEDMENTGLEKYLGGLEEHWRQPTLASHLWILSELLIMKGDREEALHTCLMRYTIAMCCPKMLRRFNNVRSEGFIQSLQDVKDDFPFTGGLKEDKDGMSSGSMNDRALLEKYVSLTKTRPSMLPFKIPHITRVLDNLPPIGEKFQLYTSDTCREFHHLLLYLLTQLKQAVADLLKIRNAGKHIKIALDRVFLNGYALVKMSRGNAFQMHLETIKGFLVEHRHADMAPSIPSPNVEGGAENTVRDDDLEAIVRPDGSRMALWMTYRDWLRLMIVHFDAANILFDYVTSRSFPHKSISIRILVSPTPDSTCLPWAQLLAADSKFIPEPKSKPGLKPDPKGPPSNEKILEFLTNASNSMSTAEKNLGHIKAAQKHWKNGNTNAFMKQKFELEKDYCVSAAELSDLYDKWKAASSKESKNQFAVNIIDKLQSMRDICQDNYDSVSLPLKLHTPLNFPGTLHCEASLASLLDRNTRANLAEDDKYAEILEYTKDFGPVIGVSKRCCPACQYLLSLLSPDGNPFIIRGSHTTVSACTLPPWTPEHIVDSMNHTFGKLLRRELVKMMASHQSKNRAQSMGSQRLSIDSDKGRDWSKDFSISTVANTADSQPIA